MSVLLRPYHAVHGIDVCQKLRIVDMGDLDVAPGNVMRTLDGAAEALGTIVAQRVFPMVLGGDHSVTLASLRALTKTEGPLAEGGLTALLAAGIAFEAMALRALRET